MKNYLWFSQPLRENGYAYIVFLIRLFVGFMMLSHGFSKLSSFHELSANFPDPLGISPMFSLILSILAEFGCSILVICGVLTRLAAIPLIINMVVAVWIVHGPDAFQMKELGVMYLAFYILLFLTGGEKYSFDAWFFGRKRKGQI